MSFWKLTIALLIIGFGFIFMTGSYGIADKTPPDPMNLQFEGAKLGPVPFSHKVHVEKEKIDCAICHHKDKNPKEPGKCTTCHLLNEVKDKASLAKDAFHNNCRTCHKESAAKGKKAPTKCNECHKK